MIRVLIERYLQEGAEHDFHLAMREMRKQALPWNGYVSGETLRDVSDLRHYAVLSTWRAREDWDEWACSAARHAILQSLEALLIQPEKVTVFESA